MDFTLKQCDKEGLFQQLMSRMWLVSNHSSSVPRTHRYHNEIRLIEAHGCRARVYEITI